MKEKLDTKLVANEITQTCRRKQKVIFRDSSIDKVDRTNITFGNRREYLIKFDVPKGSSLKGLNLKISKTTGKKYFVLSIWFNNRNQYYTIGSYPNIRCKDVERLCLQLAETHQDHRGVWIKNPLQTRSDEKRIVEKPDTTIAKGYTINEVIEAYCGAELPGEQTERGFSKDRKEGYRRAKSCRNWFRYMAGYNHRNTLIRFYDDDQGYGAAKFLPNKHLRVAKPTDMRDLFRKYPPQKGIIKDRIYYNRRKKQNYTIPASQNYSIYDSDIGKSLIHELTPGDIEAWIRDKSSWEIKIDYIKVFVSLWIFARKRGWLGTDPGECPFDNGQVYVKKETRKQDPYKHIAMETAAEFELFWKCSEEMAEHWPMKAELHQFMVLTAIRKSEALRMKKEYIDFDKGKIKIPREISKTGYQDEELPITPELEILLRNILDYENDPRFQDFYKMRDFPWLFATRRWKSERYFNKEFRMSQEARLGGDEKYIPELRKHMRLKSGDPNLIYAPKILRKSYTTLSQQIHGGRSEITKEMTRHASVDTLNKHYNKPNIETKRDYASKVTAEVFHFVRRRSA
jgi:integrase